jgi:hypothetical protein
MMPQLTEYLSTLLGDKSYYVVGAAVMAFLEMCPDRYDLIHSHYRSLVKMLIDMDEWGQLAVLRVLTGYARKSFPPRKRRRKKPASGDAGFYSDEEVESAGTADQLDPDLELLLAACPPLLQSRNSAVSIAPLIRRWPFPLIRSGHYRRCASVPAPCAARIPDETRRPAGQFAPNRG